MCSHTSCRSVHRVSGVAAVEILRSGQSHFCLARCYRAAALREGNRVYGVSVDQRSFSDGFRACRLHACRRRLSVRRRRRRARSRRRQTKAAGRGQGAGERAAGLLPEGDAKEDTGFFNRYAKGGEDDPAKLSYQASISEVTRSCSRTTGMLTMNVAVAGRVVPGPAGVSGTVTLPIRVVVLQGEEVLYSQADQPSGGGRRQPGTQFVFNDPNVTVPIPEDNTLQVFAGFDAGPPKKKQAKNRRSGSCSRRPLNTGSRRRPTIPTAQRSRRENPPSAG